MFRIHPPFRRKSCDSTGVRRATLSAKRARSLALLITSTLAVASCRLKPPPLTEARILGDLGRDELAFTVTALPDECLSWVTAHCRPDPVTSSDDALAAATAAGWIESMCKNEPNSSKLTPKGRDASAHWSTSWEDRPCNVTQRWDFIVAQYERTGSPVVAAGQNRLERVVTIPGHWIPNADGQILLKAGYARLSEVDRKETFTFFEGVWARSHLAP
jgi:hypothetical protein